MQANTLSGVARKGSSLGCLMGAGLSSGLAVENTSGLDRVCVLLPPLQQEWCCQNGIPAAWRHDIIYLFCTILPPSSHYLSFLESVCARVEAEEQNVSVAQSQRALGSSENNRLIEEKTGALPALFQQVERFWATAELQKRASVSPSCAGAGTQPRRHLDGSDQLPPSSQRQSWK